MTTPKIVEADIDQHYIDAVSAFGGITERVQYRGKRGCADHLTGFPFNRLFLVELKRPKGGKIAVLQNQDAEKWFLVGVQKVYLKTFKEVDDWVRRVACG